MKYIVWFSGGIDSTFIAWYLKKQGHEVLLVNLKNTYEPNKCCSVPTELIKIADFLWLELKIVDVTKEFKQFVIDDFVQSYLEAKTPNPCINCNEKVRFKILNKIRQDLWFERVATGHYVNKVYDEKNNVYTFWVSKDAWKDQSYMLYRLIKYQDILKYLDFPLWNFEKSYIKEILKKEKLPVNTSKESQNVCFIPDDDYPRFIKQQTFVNLPGWKIVDVNWNYLWEHKGLLYYTIWQRKWLSLNTNQKKYVVKIDYKNNVLVVWDDKDLYSDTVNLQEEIILLPGLKPDLDFIKLSGYSNIVGKIRYKGNLQPVKVIDSFKVIFENPLRAITPGQHLVLYGENQGKLVVIGGGGVIKG